VTKGKEKFEKASHLSISETSDYEVLGLGEKHEAVDSRLRIYSSAVHFSLLQFRVFK